MKNVRKVLWGIIFIAIGVLVGINALGIVDINIFFKGWWTLFIIVPSFVSLFNDEDKTGSLVGLAIGIFLLLGVNDIISFELIRKLVLPVVFVLIGVSIIFNEAIKGQITEKVHSKKSSEVENITATFSEQKVSKKDETFEAANLDAVFGGVTLDLREAKFKKEATIKASAIFGGVTIRVPNDVNIKLKATPIFGGVNNKKTNNKDSKTTIYIEAFSLFGGVDIK